jgi:hypothetical protein
VKRRTATRGNADGPLGVVAAVGVLAALVVPLVPISVTTADAAVPVVAPSAKPAVVVGDLANASRAAAEPHGHQQFRLTTHSATSRKQQLRATGVLADMPTRAALSRAERETGWWCRTAPSGLSPSSAASR